jgi:hypothetical protein
VEEFIVTTLSIEWNITADMSEEPTFLDNGVFDPDLAEEYYS